MPVYIIRAGDTAMVKIGWAEVPVDRCLELQTAHYEQLHIIRLIDGTPATERWLHRHFAAHRVRREWFDLVPEMLIIEPPQIAAPPRVTPDSDPLLASIEAFLERDGMTPTRFGAHAVGDPALVHELRRGRECRRSIRARVTRFIEAASSPATP